MSDQSPASDQVGTGCNTMEEGSPAIIQVVQEEQQWAPEEAEELPEDGLGEWQSVEVQEAAPEHQAAPGSPSASAAAADWDLCRSANPSPRSSVDEEHGVWVGGEAATSVRVLIHAPEADAQDVHVDLQPLPPAHHAPEREPEAPQEAPQEAVEAPPAAATLPNHPSMLELEEPIGEESEPVPVAVLPEAPPAVVEVAEMAPAPSQAPLPEEGSPGAALQPEQLQAAAPTGKESEAEAEAEVQAEQTGESEAEQADNLVAAAEAVVSGGSTPHSFQHLSPAASDADSVSAEELAAAAAVAAGGQQAAISRTVSAEDAAMSEFSELQAPSGDEDSWPARGHIAGLQRAPSEPDTQEALQELQSLSQEGDIDSLPDGESYTEEAALPDIGVASVAEGIPVGGLFGASHSIALSAATAGGSTTADLEAALEAGSDGGSEALSIASSDTSSKAANNKAGGGGHLARVVASMRALLSQLSPPELFSHIWACLEDCCLRVGAGLHRLQSARVSRQARAWVQANLPGLALGGGLLMGALLLKLASENRSLRVQLRGKERELARIALRMFELQDRMTRPYSVPILRHCGMAAASCSMDRSPYVQQVPWLAATP